MCQHNIAYKSVDCSISLKHCKSTYTINSHAEEYYLTYLLYYLV